MGHLFRIEGQAFEVWLAGRAGHYSLYVGEGAAVPVSRDAALDGAVVASSGDTLFVHLEGTAYEVGFVDPIARFGAAGAFAASDVARAPMPGSVVSVSVVVGQAVGANEVLVTIESMKLQIALRAPRDGVVAEVFYAAGQNFDRDAVLARLAPAVAA
jgi:3-methylcrotonyl-CoA carboxylase alpha subunit